MDESFAASVQIQHDCEDDRIWFATGNAIRGLTLPVSRILTAGIEEIVPIRPSENAQISERPPQTAASSTLDRGR
jgi:hypothetical protein